jgi:hypothetical protein
VRGERLEILARERLPTGESELQDAERASLSKDSLPLVRLQLLLRSCQLERVRAIRTVKGTPVRDLGKQRRRPVTLHG